MVDAKTFINETADKTGKFCIAEHGLVGLGYHFRDGLRPSDLSLSRNNSNCKFEMKRPESHTLTL